MPLHCASEEPHSSGARLDAKQQSKIMKQDNGTFGLIVGGLVALAAVVFIFGGGELGGKKTIEGDEDLPPIATADQN
jgi:hypothetical protein